ncbi:MAG: hypothetical protein CVV28_11560 [Methanobacteriales archaeon HGW-Methanobacteriales-1]|jgi:hypothetical protein|nr:MAG: hypothetical protein CVV28_11560 [Methanobacteriales archaeon HGW-Methanobacteriales-1]
MANPVAAAKVIDHGSSSYYDNTTHKTYKTTWKTYQYSKNYIVVKYKNYANKKLQGNTKMIITKVSKKKIKLTMITKGSYKNEDNLNSYYYAESIDYLKYSSTARNFYFNSLDKPYS